ncbi:hypothetical protein [Magnetofaba australis]|uniref:SxtJ n=1 Tax=Magnetofaba australis IT-1 TaxID=1434232 RepID=A0A1Y2K1M7_9PROT|nr:hypothetical protein [Magnetofaba australis]OSM00092.1 hypothetical protein MAIT1_00516 [Magnetofaba australis IT-1]
MSAKVKTSSDRSFGMVFTAVFGLIGAWPWLFGGGKPLIWAWIVSGLFFAAAIILPKILAPLNAVWTRLGLMMHKIMTPLIMSVLFFVVFTPMAFLLRLFKVKLIPLKYEPNESTYWIERDPHGPERASMKHQF